MPKILIIDKCWDCIHLTLETEYWTNLCWEHGREKSNNMRPVVIENPDIIDPGCQLEDAKE